MVWEKNPTHWNWVQNHKGPMIRYNLVGSRKENVKVTASQEDQPALLAPYLLSLCGFCLFVYLIVFFRKMEEFSQGTRVLLSK